MIYVVVHITKMDSPFPGTYTSVSEVKHIKQLRHFVSLRPMSHFNYYFFPHIADQNTDTLTMTANSSSLNSGHKHCLSCPHTIFHTAHQNATRCEPVSLKDNTRQFSSLCLQTSATCRSSRQGVTNCKHTSLRGCHRSSLPVYMHICPVGTHKAGTSREHAYLGADAQQPPCLFQHLRRYYCSS